MKISTFFKDEYVNHASYDNLRKIGSVVDGQKNAARKILHTVLEKGLRKKVKVFQLGAKVAEFAEYLHGDICGPIVTLAQDFPGTNNIPLLTGKGNFGTRFAPDAGAPRYIYAYGSDEFFSLFKADDTPVLRHQTFEGAPIEPVFYVPTLPILLVNGSEGLSSGFSQKILPRNPDKVREYIRAALEGKAEVPGDLLDPWYSGFTGTIEQGDTPAQWIISGAVTRVGINKVEITEVPPNYDLKGYTKVLDDLEDQGVIQSYQDKSEDDQFRFSVIVPSKTLKTWDDTTLLQKLKLQKKVTENYTAIDENNRIIVYEGATELLEHFIRVKMQYLQLRKKHLINKITDEIRVDFSRYTFIKMIVDDELVISKRRKADIVLDLAQVPNILERDGSYDYLLGMPVISLSEERLAKLEAGLRAKKMALDTLGKKTTKQIWIEEL